MSTPRSLRRTPRRKQPSRRGDVSSSAASSPSATEDEWVLPTTPPARAEAEAEADQTTPKRKVIAVAEGSKTQPRTRANLQARLQAAAKVKKSKSQGEGLAASASITQLVPKVKAETITTSTSGLLNPPAATLSASTGGSNDKVIVCVRVKPTESTFVTTAYELTQDSLTLTDHHPNVQKRGGKAGREDEYSYNFDALLQFPSRTPDLYEQRVAPLVNKAMNGYNSTIFAYGQTGSGKSFTMTGVQEELGIIPCAVDGVFDAITADPERAFLLRVSYIEIYNETLRDLLNFKKGPLKDDEKPNIHFNKGKVYVDPLVEEIVSTPQDVVDLLERGNTQRKTGATDWNERSSRSHSVFTIVIESKPRDGDGDEDVRLSRLTLIDLAGSEKAVSDLERRGEGKHINRSLLALKNVINKLTDKKSGHIPYRDSKLTHLLENALGGDSNICVICTLSGEEEHSAETLETLKFAGNCARVETKAKKNILMSSDRALIKAKDKEIEILKRRLQGLQKDDTAQPDVFSVAHEAQDLADSVAAMEARKYRLTTQLAKLNTQVLTSELPRVGSGIALVSPKPKRRRISDLHNGLGGSRVGLGSPKQKALDNRRAVSSMLRMPQVPEDEMPAIHGQLESEQTKTFDHDRIVAALRRGLATRDQDLATKASELDAAIAQVTQLQDQLAAMQAASEASVTEHESAMREFHSKLESTRSELVNTVNEKDEKIDALEATVLDLRTSREELLLEGEIRVDELKAQLATAVEETSEIKAAHASELETLSAQLDQAKAAADQLPDLKARADEADRARATAEIALEEHQKASLAREAELDESRRQVDQHRTDLEKLRNELSTRQSIEGDQAKLESLLVSEREGRKLAEKDNRALVEQLGELRQLREQSKLWAAERAELVGQLEGVKSASAATAVELNEAKSQVESHAKAARDAEERLLIMQNEAKQAKDQLHDQSSEVYSLQMKLSTNTAESSNRINSLESQLFAEKDRSKSLDHAKSTVEATLAEKQKQLDESAAEVDRLRRHIDSHSASSSEQTARLASLEEQLRIETGSRKSSEEVRLALDKEIVDLRAAVEGHESETTRLSAELDSARKRIDAAERATEDVRAEHTDAITRLQTKEDELDAAQTALDVAQRDLGAAGQANLVEIERLSGQLAHAEKELATANSSAQIRQDALLSAEDHLQARDQELKEARASIEDLNMRVEALAADVTSRQERADEIGKRLEAETKLRTAAEAALASSTAGQDEAVRSLREQLANTETELAATTAKVDAEAKAASSAQSTIAQLEKDKIDNAQAATTALAELQKRLDAASLDVTTTRTNLDAVTKEREQLLAETTTANSQKEVQLAETVGKVERLEKQLKDSSTQIDDLEDRLSSEKALRSKAESQLSQLTASTTTHEASLVEARQKLVLLQKQYDEQGHLLSTSKVDLENRVAALKKAEEGSQNATTETSRLSKELAQLHAAVASSAKRLDKAQQDLETANATIRSLTADLAAAKSAEADLRPRHASTPASTVASAMPLDTLRAEALKTTSTGDSNVLHDRLKSREKGEIERLEKVIEAQVEIINDQREKIRFWAKELEQQREVVRMLTQDGNTTPTRPSPGHGHGKSKSLSVADLENLSPRPGSGSSHAKVHLPSSFTAKNLALPTTPTPLPMHPSQYANTTARKGRRITIDHDIDLLQESSKVHKAKAVFDSPEKEERAAIALTRKKTVRMAAFTPTGSPVQRRP